MNRQTRFSRPGIPASPAPATSLSLAVALALAAVSFLPALAAGKPTGSGAQKDSVAQAVQGATININSATQEQLETLPGVGPALALRILDYRKQNGPFKATEDLLNVKGIGEKSFEKIRPFITVSVEK